MAKLNEYCTNTIYSSHHASQREKKYFFKFALNQKKIFRPSQQENFQKKWRVGRISTVLRENCCFWCPYNSDECVHLFTHLSYTDYHASSWSHFKTWILQKALGSGAIKGGQIDSKNNGMFLCSSVPLWWDDASHSLLSGTNLFTATLHYQSW